VIKKKNPKSKKSKNAMSKKTPDIQVRNRGISTRWKPGQSGNPKGRPPKRECLTSLLKEAMDSPCPQDKQKRTWTEVITEKLLTMAVKGDLTAIKLIFEYVVGKPAQMAETPSDVVLTVVYADEIEPVE
jgi:hypothetical protein